MVPKQFIGILAHISPYPFRNGRCLLALEEISHGTTSKTQQIWHPLPLVTSWKLNSGMNLTSFEQYRLSKILKRIRTKMDLCWQLCCMLNRVVSCGEIVAGKSSVKPFKDVGLFSLRAHSSVLFIQPFCALPKRLIYNFFTHYG